MEVRVVHIFFAVGNLHINVCFTVDDLNPIFHNLIGVDG